jgi:eukaryotic-like serine/threonine-protein kinase
MVGKTISHYQIIEKLGSGGMSVVYKATDKRLGRSVAIKVIEAEFTERFELEARAISALNHPHICILYDVGEQEGAPYLVMEYVEGKPLKGPLPLSEALQYAVQIAQALAAAHKAGIVHRDLKPDNILLTTEGSVKVLDFGLAKLQSSINPEAKTISLITEQKAVTGTAPYMSPEQAQGQPVDARSDIFSFGAVFYELLSGRRAFQRETIRETLTAVIGSEPPPLREAPPEVARIAAKMLAKKPEGRYQSAEELLAELEEIAHPKARLLLHCSWFIHRYRWLLAGAAVLVLLVITLMTAGIWRTSGRNIAPPPAAAVITPAEALQRAQAYLQRYDRKGNADRAIAVLEPALRSDVTGAALYAALSEAYVRKYSETSDKQWLEHAMESGRRAVAANDDLAAAHVALGITLAASGKNTEATGQFKRARDLNPLSGPAHLGLAKLLSGREAEQLYQKAITYSPGEWSPLHALAGFYFHNARYGESIACWKQALALTPDNALVMNSMAAGFHMQGLWAEAADALQRALAIDATTAQIWANLGTARYFQGLYSDAVRAMEKAVELAPSNYLYWGNLGDGYRWANGLQDKARQAYEKAIRLARERLAIAANDRLRSSLAVYLAKSGDTAGALAEVASIEPVRQSDQGTLFKTALVYELAHNRAKALSILGRAIRAGYSMHEIANEPELTALRSDPRYAAIAALNASRRKD